MSRALSAIPIELVLTELYRNAHPSPHPHDSCPLTSTPANNLWRAMKRINAFIILGVQLLAGAISGWGPTAASATEPLPRQVEADGRSVESLLPAPQPVFVEPAPPQAPVIDAALDAVSAECARPPEAVRGPLLRLWQYHNRPWQESHWGYANLFYERPFGSYLRSAVGAQVQNGLSAQMALYHF